MKARVALLLMLVLAVAPACSGPRDAATPTAVVVSQQSPGAPGELQRPVPVPYSQTIRFEHLGIAEGLSQSVVNAIIQDRTGFLWVGTEDGLNRYDGFQMKVFRPEPENPRSLSDRWITSLAEDAQGFLWVGTRQGGLNRYDPETGTFTHFRHEAGVADSLSDDSIRALYAADGDLWVATANGLDVLETASDIFLHFRAEPPNPQGLSSNSISAILKDDRNHIWIGTLDAGVSIYDPVSRTFTVLQNDPLNPASLSHNRVLSITDDMLGRVWVGAANGINLFSEAGGDFVRFQNDAGDPYSLAGSAVLAIFSDRDGGLWVGTESGLDRLDFETGRFVHHQHHQAIPNSLSNDTVRAIYEDRGGILWVGTFAGLNKYNRQQDHFAYYQHHPDQPNSLGGNRVQAIHVAPDRAVWIGTNGNGLDLFSPASQWFSHFRHDPSDPTTLGDDEVWSVLTDQDGQVWVGTTVGLDRYDPSTGDFSHFVPEAGNTKGLAAAPVYSLLQGRDGTLWIGTARGLDQYDPATESFVHFLPQEAVGAGAPGPQVTALLEDIGGALWIGTFDEGLYRMDQQAPPRFTKYTYSPGAPHSLSNNTVLSLALDSSGTVWIGTGGGGLSRFSRSSNTFTHFTEQDGLPNDVIYAILEDRQGGLWLSTNYGLSRLDADRRSFQNFTSSDGLQSNEFTQGAAARGAQGELYFGGTNGFNILRPESLAANPSVPPVVLTSLTQDGDPLQADIPAEAVREITLRWPQNSFEFEMAALSFGEPAANQYAYKMEGYDEEWNYLQGGRDGRYADLPGGEYVLLVKASNSDGIWNETPSRVRVSVTPPFWDTGWFRIVLGAGLFGLVLGSYRLRVRSIESRTRDLERVVRSRTSDLEKRTREIEALYRADDRILRNVTLSQVFQTLVDVATDMLHADRSAIFAWDQEQNCFRRKTSRGFSPDALQQFEAPESQGLLAEVLRTGEPVVVPDASTGAIATAPDRAEEESRAETMITDQRTLMLMEGMRSFANFPLKSDSKVVAVFTVAYALPGAIADDIVRLYAAVVQRAALSITNMQLFEQTKELAVIEVRNRLARDLHDSAKQKAFAALAQLGTANGLASRNGSETLRPHIAEAENLVHEVIQELTFLVQEIYPLALQEKGLAAAIREYAFEWENRNEVVLTVTIDQARPLTLEAEQAIYRVIQEALANVARHSRARRAEVRLAYHPDTLELSISDNGVGFDSSRTGAGLGLRSIRERIGSLHGTLQIQSSPDHGTRLLIQVPLKGHVL